MPRKPFWAFLVEFFFDWECFYVTDNELRFAKSRKKRVPITMKRSAAVLAFSIIALALMIPTGCSAQLPTPTKGYNVSLTWSAPTSTAGWAGCTTAAPCTYGVWRAPAAAGVCPAATSTAWQELNATALATTASYLDATATGLDVCYAVHTVQGTQNSGPSNVVQLVVPGVPTAPALATPNSTQQSSTQLPQGSEGTTVAEIGSLRATLVRTRR